MNLGITSFREAASPPGDMSYCITDIPQYSSLEPCAQIGLFSAAMYQTLKLCPTDGPQALASCACIKNSVSRSMSSVLSFEVRDRCNIGVLENLSSANSILNGYCDAANAKTTNTGILLRTATASTTATQTNSPDGSDDGGSKGPSAGVTAGAAVAGIVGIVACIVALWFIRRRGKRNGASVAPTVNDNRGISYTSVPQHSQPQDAQDGNISPVPDDLAPPPYESGPVGKGSTKT